MTDADRIRLPALEASAPRPGIPVVAALAPVVVALVIWLITSSPFVLLFAALGPVVAIAGYLDGRRTRRRARRRAVDDALRRIGELAPRVDDRARARRAALDSAAPDPADELVGVFDGRPPRLRLGDGDLIVDPAVDGADEVDPEIAEAVARLVARARRLPDAPVVVDARDLALIGPRALTRAHARGLALQLAARLPLDGLIRAPREEEWIRLLPHRTAEADGWEFVSDSVTTRLHERDGAPGVVVRLDDTTVDPPGATLVPGTSWRPLLVGAAEAHLLARRLGEAARASGWRGESELPRAVGLHQLLADAEERTSSSAPIGRDADGVVAVDLTVDGPHALIAGTTGSGKSELLITWVLALASCLPPEHLAVLFVDFKGGASAVPIEALPHLVGVVSDLDPTTATRAVESLRAEVRRRERVLAEHRVRAIDELVPDALPRLLIVVDEYAALVATDPELAAVFADIAARGRTLGMHLLLCTQRPTGVVRDAVLANVTLRVCLRVIDPIDSSTVVGVADAAALDPAARGRAILRDGRGVRAFQVALAEADAAERIARRWQGRAAPAVRPWLDPLPPVIAESELPPCGDPRTLVVGLVDVPSEQRRGEVAVRPWDGGVVVAGAGGSGRSSALRLLARRAADAEVRRAATAAELWAALEAPAAERDVLVVADDLDRMLTRLDVEHAAALVERVDRANRDARGTRLAVAASTQSLTGLVGQALAGVEQRLLLRCARRDEHVMLGGDPRLFRAQRTPGGGEWRGREMQLGFADDGPVPAWSAPLEELAVPGGAVAIASPRPAALRERLSRAGHLVGDPGSGTGVEIAEPEAWLAEHHALARVRREGGILLVGCSPADHRALTRDRILPPPLEGDAEAWWCVDGSTRRVRVAWPAERAQA